MRSGALKLAGVFVVCFIFPIWLGLFWLGGDSSAPSREYEQGESVHSAYKITGDRSFVKFTHAPDLNPLENKDFLLTAWVKPRRLPKEGDRISLISKYLPDTPKKQGYVIAYSSDKLGGRISVYWRDSLGKGRWFQFEPFPLVPDEWFMVAVSYVQGRYLGVHTISALPGRKAEVMLGGGYDLGEGGIYPDADADLIFGALTAAPFKGELGPIGIAQRGKIGVQLKEILKQMSRDPLAFTSLFPTKSIRLWSPDLRQDQSAFHHVVERINEHEE